MSFPVLRAYLILMSFERFLARKDFAGLHSAVRSRTLRTATTLKEETMSMICSDVDRACLWYWKQVLCLQRSAATACLLKDNGIPAQLVIGVQRMPFKAHAWVEVENRVVNDLTYTKDMYLVLDRC